VLEFGAVPDLAAARALLRSGSLDAVLVGNSEVLAKQRGLAAGRRNGTLAGALA
jgi:hypothetical protein